MDLWCELIFTLANLHFLIGVEDLTSFVCLATHETSTTHESSLVYHALHLIDEGG